MEDEPIINTPVKTTPEIKSTFEITPEIEEFLCEFANNAERRKVLLDAIQNKKAVDGGTRYFQARLKEIQGA